MTNIARYADTRLNVVIDMKKYIKSDDAKSVIINLLVKALDYFNSIPDADVQEKKQWICIKDKLPEKHQNCLVWTGSAVMTSMYLGKNEWWLDYYDHAQTVSSDWFSHWMPLPEPPKGRIDYDIRRSVNKL